MTKTITLPVKLARKLDAASERSKRSPEELAREAIAEKLSYLEWKEKAIKAGELDLRRRRIVTTEELLATLTRQRQARAKSRSKAA
jgi:predicted transcriptional regulator